MTEPLINDKELDGWSWTNKLFLIGFCNDEGDRDENLVRAPNVTEALRAFLLRSVVDDLRWNDLDDNELTQQYVDITWKQRFDEIEHVFELPVNPWGITKVLSWWGEDDHPDYCKSHSLKQDIMPPAYPVDFVIASLE